MQCGSAKRSSNNSLYLLYEAVDSNNSYESEELIQDSINITTCKEKHFIIICNHFAYDLITKDKNKYRDVSQSFMKNVRKCENLTEAEAKSFHLNYRLGQKDPTLFIVEKHKKYLRIYEVWPSVLPSEDIIIKGKNKLDRIRM